jgi:hypothetical protein
MFITQDVDNTEYLLYRILCGFYYIEYNDKKYKVIYPSLDIKYQAEQVYLSTLDDHKFDTEWFSELDLRIFLEKQNIWNNDKENYLKSQQNLLEKSKIDLYKDYSNGDLKKKHKKLIQSLYKNINDLIIEKESFNYLTLNFFANTVKHEFLLMNTIFNNDILLLNNKSDHKTIQEISIIILKEQISMNKLRKIARSDIWKSYYNDNGIYANGVINTNDDYRNLVNLTKMYESIKQHPECPTEDIISDDDALDGWFLLQKDKSTKEKQKNQVLDRVRGNKIKDAKELFIITQDKQETDQIFGLNDPKTMRDIKNSVELAKQKGKVSWTDLEHVIEEKLIEQGKGGYNKIKENIK